jgi:tripartite-type tricarboxylate transporter receptor subunit TctC
MNPVLNKSCTRLIAVLSLTFLFCSAAFTADLTFPNKPLKLIVGFPSGSSADVTARIVAKRLGEILQQAVIVDNRPGASSNIATDAVVRSAPDGYTLLLGSVANTINAGMGKNLPFNFATDLAPIALITNLPNILVVHPSLGVTTVQELIALAKAKPSLLNYASSGNGTSPHLSGELFNLMANVKTTHVPYKGSSQAISDVLSGLVPVMFSPSSTAIAHINSGSLKALAVTSAQRSAVSPKLPTISESGLAGYETSVWFCILAPAQTPKDILDRLNSAVNLSLQSTEVKSQLLTQGIDTMGGTREELAKYIQTDTEKWEKLIKLSGAKMD